MRKRQFEWDKHVGLGRELYDFRNQVLIKAACDVPNTYGKNGREARAARRALDAIDHLRSVLDDCVCREHREPDKQPTRVYYPGDSSA